MIFLQEIFSVLKLFVVQKSLWFTDINEWITSRFCETSYSNPSVFMQMCQWLRDFSNFYPFLDEKLLKKVKEIVIEIYNGCVSVNSNLVLNKDIYRSIVSCNYAEIIEPPINILKSWPFFNRYRNFISIFFIQIFLVFVKILLINSTLAV